MENSSFILRDTKNLDKLSCHSHDPKVLRLIDNLKKKGFLLSKISEKLISGPMGFQLHTYDYVPENYPDKVKLLQISNINEFGEFVDTKRDKFISKEKNEELEKSQARKDDLVITKVGATLGKTGIIRTNEKGNLNQSVGIIRLKKEFDNIKILPEFIHLFINSYYGNAQLKRLGWNRAGQPGLSIGEVGSIYVILPSEIKQKEILEKIDRIRKEAFEHYKKYLFYANESKNKPLEILKIKIPSENKKTFIFNKDIKNRLDAINNSPFLENLKNNIKSYGFKELKYFLKEAENKFTYSDFYNLIDLDNIDENTSEIKYWEEVRELGSTKTTFKTNNILISKLGGEKGNILLIEEKFNDFLGSGELIDFQLRTGFDKRYLFYLFYLLRSLYISKQMQYTLTGCSRMRINSTDMEKLLIPFIEDDAVINKIIKECSELREKAIFEKRQYKKKMRAVLEKFTEFLKVY